MRALILLTVIIGGAWWMCARQEQARSARGEKPTTKDVDDAKLDEALAQSFPASDPVSMTIPKSPKT